MLLQLRPTALLTKTVSGGGATLPRGRNKVTTSKIPLISKILPPQHLNGKLLTSFLRNQGEVAISNALSGLLLILGQPSRSLKYCEKVRAQYN